MRPPGPYRYSTLTGFLEIYRQVASTVRPAADRARVLGEHARAMAGQDIRYAEVSVNPSLHPGEDWLEGLVDARRAAGREHGVEIAWLVELTREGSAGENERAVEIALSLDGAVGIGLVGDESIPVDSVAPFVERAHARGLRFMPHAGQTGGPAGVREALDSLDADRLAHGIGAASDPTFLRELAGREICLCVCPSSNACIGLRPDFRALASSGVTLTVNSDDPSFVGTSLTRELELAESRLGL